MLWMNSEIIGILDIEWKRNSVIIKMPSTDLEMTKNESINEAGENGVQECIPVPATVPPKCVHPFDCLCPPERVSLFVFLLIWSCKEAILQQCI